MVAQVTRPFNKVMSTLGMHRSETDSLSAGLGFSDKGANLSGRSIQLNYAHTTHCNLSNTPHTLNATKCKVEKVIFYFMAILSYST